MGQNVKSPDKEVCFVRQNCRSHLKAFSTVYNIVINITEVCKLRDKISDHFSTFSTLWDKLVIQMSKNVAVCYVFYIVLQIVPHLERSLWYSGPKIFDIVRQNCNSPLKIFDTVRQSFDSALRFFDTVRQTCFSNLKLLWRCDSKL